MFFKVFEDAVENAVDVGLGIMTLGEYGDFSKKTVSKMIANGVEIYAIAQFFDVGIDVIEDMIKDDE